MRVLVVDDDAAICYVVHRALAERGHAVTVCESSNDAWKIVRQGFDVLVTDILFPNGQPHGLALSNHARSRNCNMLVIFITGYANYVGDLSTANEIAFVKPFELTKLVEIVDSYNPRPLKLVTN